MPDAEGRIKGISLAGLNLPPDMELQPGVYEECSHCGGGGEGCRRCWDQGVEPHDCPCQEEE